MRYWIIDMLVNAANGAIVFTTLGTLRNWQDSPERLFICGAIIGALLAFSLRCFGGRLVCPR